MRLYHRTSRSAAHAIIAQGFRDAWGYYLTDRLWYGVWLSEVPHDTDEGAGGDVLLTVTIYLHDDDLAEYAWVEFNKPHRKFLLPADLINRWAKVQVVEDEQAKLSDRTGRPAEARRGVAAAPCPRPVRKCGRPKHPPGPTRREGAERPSPRAAGRRLRDCAVVRRPGARLRSANDSTE